MTPSHKIFFAIPFDKATKAMYERIASTVRNEFPTVTTVIGKDEVGPSPAYSGIKSFRAQNVKLMDQFVAQIRDADIVVADLSHNNPNVHVELGVALTQNKNILRVTGRPHTELGFDIRDLEVHAYGDEEDLKKRLVRYLTTFLEIKTLTLSAEHGDLYYRLPEPIELKALDPRVQFATVSPAPPSYVIRDGAVRATFEILRTQSVQDWFGIYIRSGDSPLLGGHLVYVRQNGSVELGVYPGPRIIEKFQLPSSIVGKQTLLIEFENDKLAIEIGGLRFESDKLWYQSAGRIAFAAWQADVILHAAEAISRDTIEWAAGDAW